MVAPARIITLGVTIATDGVSLLKVIVTFEGAGAGRLTAIGVEAFGVTVTPDCKPIDCRMVTVTLTEASGMFGSKFAWIRVDPPVPRTPVIGTETELLPAGMVTVAGTVATPVLSECRLIVRAFGVVAESVSVKFCVVPPESVRAPGGKLTVAVTFTVALLVP